VTRRVRLVLADDHAIVRRGLREVLAAEPDLEVIGEAATAAEVLALADRLPWDVLVLDLSMPGSTGLETLKALRARHPRRPVLVCTMHPEAQFALRVLRAGAAGYLTKEHADREIVAAVRRVAQGGRYVSGTAAELLAASLGERDDGPPHERLTDREFEVFRLLGAGRSVTEIAALLRLSVKTVSTHRANILQKLSLQHNGEVIRYAVDHGLA
jgi:DNA-binding NarL/FixJ family response regulator